MNTPEVNYAEIPGFVDITTTDLALTHERRDKPDFPLIDSTPGGEPCQNLPDANQGDGGSEDVPGGVVSASPDEGKVTQDAEKLEVRLAKYIADENQDGFLDDKSLHKELAKVEHSAPARWIKLQKQLKPLVNQRELTMLVKPHRPPQGHRSARRSSNSTEGCEDQGIKYVEQNGWIKMEQYDPRADSVIYIGLASFTARVAERVVLRDGLTDGYRFRVIGADADGKQLPELDLSSLELSAMDWPTSRWGRALEAAPRVKDHIKSAIFKLSGEIRDRVVYAHTGWIKDGDRWRYLHVGGAIDADGNDRSVQVQLPDRLANYELPTPPVGAELRKAIRAVFGLLDLADPCRSGSEVAAAVALCLPFRVALGETVFNVWIEGLSGAFKTEFAGNVLQRFFGAGFDRVKAPAGWFSTSNAIEIQAFAAKDVLMLIDDYRPPEGLQRSNAENMATRILRNAVDRRGRDRARTDGSLQASKYPRGTILVTAECGPPSGDQAAIGRTLILKVTADRPEIGILGTFNPGVLRRLSADAEAGHYASAMSGFLRWVAPRYKRLRQGMRSRVDRLADQFRSEMDSSGMHQRTPEIVADLFIGLEVFLEFALEEGAITADEAEYHREVIQSGLIGAAHDQRMHHSESDPIERFFLQLSSALTNGTAILTDRQGEAPYRLEAACGWKSRGPEEWRDESRYRAGWIEGNTVYLILENAYAAALTIGPLPFDSKTLSRRLKDKNLLLRTEGGRSNSIKRTYQGASQRVLVLHLNSIVSTSIETEGESDQTTFEEVVL